MVHSHTLLALDVGEKRIGVATANSIAKIAMPLTTLTMSEHIVQEIVGLSKENDIHVVIVGLPRNQAGEETAQSAYSRDFAKQLTESGLTVEFQDESLTSQAAENELQSRKKPYTKADIDALAAALILQDYLGGVTYA